MVLLGVDEPTLKLAGGDTGGQLVLAGPYRDGAMAVHVP
jgi:hypothetical protein